MHTYNMYRVTMEAGNATALQVIPGTRSQPENIRVCAYYQSQL